MRGNTNTNTNTNTIRGNTNTQSKDSRVVEEKHRREEEDVLDLFGIRGVGHER